MEQNQSNNSAAFGNVPNDSEPFGNIPRPSEDFRTGPKSSERSENHTLTVREAARMFESAGVARTERSIVNWCGPNKLGMPRLDAYFDPNERKYYITPQSVELAIAEEKAKAAKLKQASEPGGSVPKHSRWPEERPATGSENKTGRIREMEQEIFGLRIADRAKDQVIDHLREERKEIIDRLMNASRRVGELETRLLRLEEPSRLKIASQEQAIEGNSEFAGSDSASPRIDP